MMNEPQLPPESGHSAKVEAIRAIMGDRRQRMERDIGDAWNNIDELLEACESRDKRIAELEGELQQDAIDLKSVHESSTNQIKLMAAQMQEILAENAKLKDAIKSVRFAFASCWQHRCSDNVGGCTGISEHAKMDAEVAMDAAMQEPAGH